MGNYRRGRVSVEVEVSDVIDEIEDDHLIEEAKRRKLILPADVSPQPYVKDYVQMAHEELMGGRAASALALLDRALFPTAAEKTDDGKLVFKRTA